MPTISFSFSDFQKLLGKKISIDEFSDMALMYAKAEVDDFDKSSGEVKLSLDDTNLPYLWRVEGLARLFRGLLGIEGGIPKVKYEKSNLSIKVDPELKKFRPFISSFVAYGSMIDEYLLEQLIQLQEKFCEGYGR